jgi:hypothetical protein
MQFLRVAVTFEHLDAEVPVLDGSGDGSAGLTRDEPSERAPKPP